MSANIKLNIGPRLDNSQYSSVQIAVILTKAKLDSTIESIKKKTGLKEAPIVTIEFPKLVKGVLNSKNRPVVSKYISDFGVQFSELQTKDKIYWIGQMKKEESQFFINIQQSFKEVTNLDNNIDLTLDLFNVDKWHQRLLKGQPPVTVMFDSSQITGQIWTDPKLLDLLKKILIDISPQFLQSPIIAGLEHFEIFDCQFNLESFDSIEESIRKQIFQPEKPYKLTEDDLTNKLINSDEQIVFYFTLPKLFCLKFKAKAKILGIYFTAFPFVDQPTNP